MDPMAVVIMEKGQKGEGGGGGLMQQHPGDEHLHEKRPIRITF